jgi:hypothetical protein
VDEVGRHWDRKVDEDQGYDVEVVHIVSFRVDNYSLS